MTFLKHRRGSSTVGRNTYTLCEAESQRRAIMDPSAATLLISKDLVWVGRASSIGVPPSHGLPRVLLILRFASQM